MNNTPLAGMDAPGKEKCGVVGIYNSRGAVDKCYMALHSLQHRGQESAGMAVSNGQTIEGHVGMGLVSDVFSGGPLKKLTSTGDVVIGHVRYSTSGASRIENAQPMIFEYSMGQVAIAHNGNLTNAMMLRDEYEAYGHIFRGTSDSEIIIHLLAKPSHVARKDTLAHVLRHLEGAFCLVILGPDQIEAARDSLGIRPLCIGKLPDGTYMVASETCALDILDATFIRDVEPGEIVTLDATGIHSRFFVEPGTLTPAHCIFEQVYFSDPSSDIFGENVHRVRMEMGRQLAREAPVDADAVIPVPNCARCAAGGYAEESGMPYERGFTVSHYAGRSFIEPEQPMRDLAVRMKLNVIRDVVVGKRLVVIEDSVVRGTTTRGKIGALRRAGAKEIHLRVASPPIRYPCFYGIDFPDQNELIANGLSVDQIAKYLEVDSLAYISLDGMLSCVKHPANHYCTACWSGKYPIAIDKNSDKLAFENRQQRLF